MIAGLSQGLRERLRAYPDEIFAVERSYNNALKEMQLLDVNDLRVKLREYCLALTLCRDAGMRLRKKMLQDANLMEEQARQPIPPEEADFWQISLTTLYVELGTLAQMLESCEKHLDFIRSAEETARLAAHAASEIQMVRLAEQVREMAKENWRR